jgi:hypothetical protein
MTIKLVLILFSTERGGELRFLYKHWVFQYLAKASPLFFTGHGDDYIASLFPAILPAATVGTIRGNRRVSITHAVKYSAVYYIVQNCQSKKVSGSFLLGEVNIHSLTSPSPMKEGCDNAAGQKWIGNKVAMGVNRG